MYLNKYVFVKLESCINLESRTHWVWESLAVLSDQLNVMFKSEQRNIEWFLLKSLLLKPVRVVNATETLVSGENTKNKKMNWQCNHNSKAYVG